MSKKKIVVLVSGMDSLLALKLTELEYQNEEIIPVWYDLGLPFSEAEYAALPERIQRRDFKGYGNILPKRDVEGVDLFPFMYEGILYDVMRHYQADKIVMGVLMTDSALFEDNTLGWAYEFNERFERDILSFPLAEKGYGKIDVIKRAKSLAMNLGELTRSHTCRSKLHGEFGCGSCFSCMRKKGAYHALGMTTQIPSPFETPSIRLVAMLQEYCDAFDSVTLDGNKLDFMNEFIPYLEEETGIANDVHRLKKHVEKHYIRNSGVIKAKLEAYDAE
ncbi:hypothetical protein VCR15J2_390136 [Vibrio coralliirubri]|uniref:7-cyano-7-deazaguanine synthase n=1 Tax=Vibrio coralliirubri TaxID=1516159 RepID=UPI000636B398|nr:7-cyano-7-deazaguanine synthase [Vibrio coralliirubri]CDT54147.1 hypothetical protein VCR15J2_390136 [Vibrio coralliirubri]